MSAHEGLSRGEPHSTTRRAFLEMSSKVAFAGGAVLTQAGRAWPAETGKTIRMGVVGGNFGATFHWHEHPNCVVTGVTDLRPDRRERAGAVVRRPGVALHAQRRSARGGRDEKGDRSNLPERPEGCFAQIGPVPFSASGASFRSSGTPGAFTRNPNVRLHGPHTPVASAARTRQ